MTTKIRNDWIDLAKGLCIVLVVMHHYVQLAYAWSLAADASVVYNGIAAAWQYFDRAIAPLRMPLFFFLSGYLVRRHIVSSSPGQAFSSRALQLIWLIVLWAPVQWACVGLFNQIVPGNPNYALVTDAIYAQTPSGYFANSALGNNSLWYLYALLIYVVVCNAFRNNRACLTVLLATLYAVTHWCIDSVAWGPESLIHNALFFLLGAYYGDALVRYCQQPDRQVIAVATLFGLGAMLSYGVGFSLRFLGSFVAVGCLLWVTTQITHVVPRKRLNWLYHLGRNTLYIYIFHRLLIELLTLGLVSSPGIVAISNDSVALLWYALSPVAVGLLFCAASIIIGQTLARRLPFLFRLPARKGTNLWSPGTP